MAQAGGTAVRQAKATAGELACGEKGERHSPFLLGRMISLQIIEIHSVLISS